MSGTVKLVRHSWVNVAGGCVRVVVTLSLLYLSVCVTLTARGGQDPMERGRRKQGGLEGMEREREANRGERDQRDRQQKR